MAGPLFPHDVFLDVFDHAPVRNLQPGEVLIAAGSPADHVYNTLSGMLMLTRTGRDGRRQVLSFLFRDNFVGLTSTDHYFFTVEAVTPARVACCTRQAFNARLERDPAAERAFHNMMYRVLEDMLDAVYSLGQRSAAERLAVFLLYLRHWHRLADEIADDGDPRLNDVALPMTREDIADFLGLTKETVSRSFGALERRGLIRRRDSHQVQIADLGALRELAGVLDFAAPRRLVAH
ncbi:MAG: Crp/Fnr family transcriptional regulator [Gammaproteobacteria bacterium]|jgi:CRP/FNR family transcriptional regulator|nr:Crp/Fnr family transcriptional regulator [Gammaproteobacteria bacterium]